MKIIVHSAFAKLDEEVRNRIENRAQMVLKKFETHILRVILQLLDINGPRGGRDKSYRIEVRLLPSGTVFVEYIDVEVYASIEGALDRAAIAISRTVKRGRTRERALAA